MRDLDLAVPEGSVYGLLGPNGAGKSTTIRMILDIIAPDRGEVEIFGSSDVIGARPHIGYLPEERGLYAKMKVAEHLAYLAVLKGVDRRLAMAAARKGLDRVGLGDRADDKVESLSKGMAQKAQMLSCLLHEPRLLILDEPFSGLDPLNVEMFKELIRERRAAGATVLFSTHMIEDAERLCDRVCMIAGSRKVLDGRVADVKAAQGQRDVAVQYEGDGTFLRAPGLVQRVADQGQYAEIRLEEGADAQDLLRRAVEQGVRLSRFEIMDPSLRQIFIEKATEVGLSAEDESEDEAGAPR